MMPGDEVVVEIEGLGRLVNPVRPDQRASEAA
jgi:2-keto-4-pentenoate hydratase/2-oxohepta-3-ene-1,7-dioic acid hydratase in catechol pathway